MKRFVLVLTIFGTMLFAASAVHADWGSTGSSSAMGYGSTGSSFYRAQMGYGSTGSSFGYRSARFTGGSTGSLMAYNGGSTGSILGYNSARFSGGCNSGMLQAFKNRRFAPIRNTVRRIQDRRAQRLAARVQRGMELNAIQSMPMQGQFLLVPEVEPVFQLQEVPQVQILVPEVSVIKIEKPSSFALINTEPDPVPEIKPELIAKAKPPQKFRLVTVSPVVAVVEPESVADKMRKVRHNRRKSGNTDTLLLVSR